MIKGEIADKNPRRMYKYREKLKILCRPNPKTKEIKSKNEKVEANDCFIRKDKPKKTPVIIRKRFS